MKNIIKGKIYVGIAHPLYEKEVSLIVLADECGYDRRQTYVRTVDKVKFTNRTAFRFENGKNVGEVALPDIEEYVEGYLVKED